ncbi:MAG TPA: non-homologous end-joining DNA ligase [Candidatus Humimicrobiaceae bacterium]
MNLPDVSKISGAEKRSQPHNIKPMLATLADKAFNKEGWFFEIKWDGYRAIAELAGSKVNLYSRNGISFNEIFVSIKDSLQKISYSAIFDGEVVVLDKYGRSSFQLLQQYRKTGKGEIVYYIFDLLYFNGHALMNVPLLERKNVLKKILPKMQNLKFSDHIERAGIKMFKAAQKNDLEGIIGKDKDSFYLSGIRSRSWLKIKTRHEQEVVIGGFTEPGGGRKNFGALAAGVYDKNDLIFVGLVGGGFSEDDLDEIKKKLDKIVTDKSPFKEFPKIREHIHWVKPGLVAEVKFAEWTNDNLMRQPVFIGLRVDKSPFDVRMEKPEKKNFKKV